MTNRENFSITEGENADSGGSSTIKIPVYTFLTNNKNTGVKYYHQDETTSHSAFAEEVYLLCEKNIRVASSDKLVITFKFDVALRISTMIPT